MKKSLFYDKILCGFYRMNLRENFICMIWLVILLNKNILIKIIKMKYKYVYLMVNILVKVYCCILNNKGIYTFLKFFFRGVNFYLFGFFVFISYFNFKVIFFFFR